MYTPSIIEVPTRQSTFTMSQKPVQIKQNFEKQPRTLCKKLSKIIYNCIVFVIVAGGFFCILTILYQFYRLFFEIKFF